MRVLLIVLLVSCATPVSEEETVSDWRRCAQECPEIFIINFNTDPPTCVCMEP
ncbi:MAG: hypothetical protein V3S71_06495 [Acidobacteriota bacterium]